MRCPHAQRLLSLRRDEDLSAHETHALVSHLAGCAACRHYEVALSEIAADLHVACPTPPELPLTQRALARWHAEADVPQRSSRPMQRMRFASVGTATLVGAGMMALVVCFLSFRLSFQGHTTRQKIGLPVATGPRLQLGSTSPSPQVGPKSVPAAAVTADIRSQYISTLATGPVGPTPFADRHAVPPPTPAGQTDDLATINTDVAGVVSRWNSMDGDQAQAQLAWLQASVRGGDDFVKIPLPPIAGTGYGALRAAVIAYRRQAAIVDARLQHRVTLAAKGVPLSDLCRQLRTETGIELHAGRSVADDKITVFCTKRPLRDLMRQITRLFGFTWLRDGEEGSFRYELAQDLRSQLLEEELRNRDRDTALLALDREMERYRKYLPLSPEEARRQIAKAPEGDANLLHNLSGAGWGPVHLYFMLSPQEQRALREEPELRYDEMNSPGESPLPPGLRDNILSALPDVRITTEGGSIGVTTNPNAPGMTPTEFPGSRANLTLQLDHGQLDRYTLTGASGVLAVTAAGSAGTNQSATLAVGISPTLANLNNAAANARLANTPAMRRRVSVTTKPSSYPGTDYNHREPSPRATIADALEALHKATGQDIVADHYTRLYNARDLSTEDLTLFETLNRLADKLCLRWKQDSDWLAFRSATYYYDRLKEVPDRLLARWAESKRKNGALTVSELTEIAGLTDAQLDSTDVAEGAWAIYNLNEWPWVQERPCRDHWRLLADLSPQLQEAVTAANGISFADLPAAQEQRCIALLLPPPAYGRQLRLQEFESGTLRVRLPKPEKIREVPQGQSFSPMDYGPVFHYQYGAAPGRRKTRDIGPYGTSSSG